MPDKPLTLEKFLAKVTHWTKQQSDIYAIALVGSHARYQAKLTSDIDLCIISENPEKYTTENSWATQFGNIQKIQIEHYGKAVSLRVFYKNSLEVEFSFVPLDWASQPIDEGTLRVIKDGIKIIYDPKKNLSNLVKYINFEQNAARGSIKRGLQVLDRLDKYFSKK